MRTVSRFERLELRSAPAPQDIPRHGAPDSRQDPRALDGMTAPKQQMVAQYRAREVGHQPRMETREPAARMQTLQQQARLGLPATVLAPIGNAPPGMQDGRLRHEHRRDTALREPQLQLRVLHR